jgi:hypothetical protein
VDAGCWDRGSRVAAISRGYDAQSALAEDQQAGDSEHLGAGDHVGEHSSRPWDRGGQAAAQHAQLIAFQDELKPLFASTG